LGVVTIKGTKGVVKCNEKLCFHYFEELALIVFNEFFVRLFKFCLCALEVGIPWIWNPFIMLESLFTLKKKHVEWWFLGIFTFGCVFYYSNLHQIFSKKLFILIYFIKMATCDEPFKNPFEFYIMIIYWILTLFKLP